MATIKRKRKKWYKADKTKSIVKSYLFTTTAVYWFLTYQIGKIIYFSDDLYTFIVFVLLVLVYISLFMITESQKEPFIVYGECIDKQVEVIRYYFSRHNIVHYYVKVNVSGNNLIEKIKTVDKEFKKASRNGSCNY